MVQHFVGIANDEMKVKETPLAERMKSVISRLASNRRMWPVTVGCER
jgi:hypothetical protein